MNRIKYTVLICFILFLANKTNAQNLIAVHNESGTTFHTTLDSAILKATNGDYIYLYGGSFKISKPINKQLQIVGVGHNPDSCAVTGITQVTGDFIINSGSDHGSITGLKIHGNIKFTVSATDPVVNYYSIERCNFESVNLATRLSNILVNECVIHGNITGSITQGFQLTKCIVEGNSITGFVANAYFINNIFMSSTSLYSLKGCFFKNNIFITTVSSSYCNDNLFQNNYFNTASEIPYIGLHHNNIVGPVTELFKNKTKALFDYLQDYHILSTSLAHNAGTDGTDLGIYGTANPWKEGSLPGNPHIQHIQSKSVSTLNGNLDVKIKVAAQDY